MHAVPIMAAVVFGGMSKEGLGTGNRAGLVRLITVVSKATASTNRS